MELQRSVKPCALRDAGSSPATRTMRRLSHSEEFTCLDFDLGLVAQLVERLPEEQRVGGSIPSQATITDVAGKTNAIWSNTRECPVAGWQ